jgi:hypothetical protein
MISYQANYEVGSKPYICKVFTASNGEEVHTALHFANEDERKGFSSELIFQHLENVIKYIQDTSKDLAMIALDEPVGSNPWAIKGWEKLEWANAEAYLWWNDVYYRPESPVNNQPNQVIYISGDEHVHTEEADHTHDPVTGEEIPNA